MIKVALLLATALFENHRCKSFSSICHFALLVSSRSTSQHMLLVAMKPWMFKALDCFLRQHIAGIKLVLVEEKLMIMKNGSYSNVAIIRRFQDSLDIVHLNLPRNNLDG